VIDFSSLALDLKFSAFKRRIGFPQLCAVEREHDFSVHEMDRLCPMV